MSLFSIRLELNENCNGFEVWHKFKVYTRHLDDPQTIKSIQPELLPHLIKASTCKTSEAALEILKDMSDKKFDPPVQYAYLTLSKTYPDDVTIDTLKSLVQEKLLQSKSQASEPAGKYVVL